MEKIFPPPPAPPPPFKNFHKYGLDYPLKRDDQRTSVRGFGEVKVSSFVQYRFCCMGHRGTLFGAIAPAIIFWSDKK